MFSSNDSNLLKVKLCAMLILSIILCQMIWVLAVPLPLQGLGAMDDLARLGGNGAKISATGIDDASKGQLLSLNPKIDICIKILAKKIDGFPLILNRLDFVGLNSIRTADDVVGNTKAMDSMSKIRNAGPDTFESGKNFDSASSAVNGKGPTTLPGDTRPSGKLSFDRMTGLFPNVKGKFKDLGSKATKSLSDSSQAVRSKAGVLRDGLAKLKKLPKFSKQNLKSWITKSNSKARQSLSRLAIKRGRQGTATLGGNPWSPKRIAGFFSVKPFKSFMNKFSNKAAQSFSKLKKALGRSSAAIGQGSRQFVQRIARLFPKKSFNILMTRFKMKMNSNFSKTKSYLDLGKGILERIQRFRQTKKVQPERPMVPETQPGQAGKTMVPETQPGQTGKTVVPDEADGIDDLDEIDGFSLKFPSQEKLAPPKNPVKNRWQPKLETIVEEQPTLGQRLAQSTLGQRLAQSKLFGQKPFKSLMTQFKDFGKKVLEKVQNLRQSKKVQPEKVPGQAGKTTVPDEADEIDGFKIDFPSQDRLAAPKNPWWAQSKLFVQKAYKSWMTQFKGIKPPYSNSMVKDIY
ncbi:uncharacterized protein MELLADRAFT_63262 [Melampsora larici-populina 98AG31]|uniref:Uncharacterized protein n=1 Tax=Melampsora larici-populina (strain 98AG31 / pathotype 3-4-7) TaxID=747676 RepID=F4RM05_MELLP|nr:uncharacterized protein MELLADRAFT_63262 [Melampsora larici-populina 98AG31]EGG06672.1 hypothetical protein MELLADRAFT_63262 [Melampsora larici-populina 98AG31]